MFLFTLPILSMIAHGDSLACVFQLLEPSGLVAGGRLKTLRFIHFDPQRLNINTDVKS